MNVKVTSTVDIQRRQAVIEKVPSGVLLSLRWDGHVQGPWSSDMSVENAKRYMAVVQFGRDEHDVAWSFNEVGGQRVWYSDVYLTVQGGRKPTDAEIEAYRRSYPRSKS